MMDRVIIDTSAWIDAFRSGSGIAFRGLVKDLILQGRVLLPGIIKAEILRGTKNKKEYGQMVDLLKGLAYLPVDETFWDGLADFSFKLFRKGIVVPLTDTYITLLCIENNVPLLHNDKHFELISQKFPLKIFNL